MVLTNFGLVQQVRFTLFSCGNTSRKSMSLLRNRTELSFCYMSTARMQLTDHAPLPQRYNAVLWRTSNNWSGVWSDINLNGVIPNQQNKFNVNPYLISQQDDEKGQHSEWWDGKIQRRSLLGLLTWTEKQVRFTSSVPLAGNGRFSR